MLTEFPTHISRNREDTIRQDDNNKWRSGWTLKEVSLWFGQNKKKTMAKTLQLHILRHLHFFVKNSCCAIDINIQYETGNVVNYVEHLEHTRRDEVRYYIYN